VLVLNTSHETVIGLRTRLEDMHDIIVLSQEGTSNRQQAKTFLTLTHEGKRPLWLAVGGAWTGLDLGGHDPYEELLGCPQLSPSNDNVLTDLVIPRLPFGTNNSMSHVRRVRMQRSFPWDLLDAAFRFLQGLGRLVRRRGLSANRRIWILDGRLGGTDAKSRLSLFWSAIESWKPHDGNVTRFD
jgi:CRISPR type IV-associated DEAD/DEAH-box helicase Csf4